MNRRGRGDKTEKEGKAEYDKLMGRNVEIKYEEKETEKTKHMSKR
jgi:hypothetical protein